MSELSANRLWPAVPDNLPSQYARMIPGSLGPIPAAANHPYPRLVRHEEPDRHSRYVAKYLLPRPTAPDRFLFFRLLAADLVVLFGSCVLPSLISPTWSLPLDVLPVYVVLVTLFGFSEGLYKEFAEAPLRVMMAPITKSFLFATVMVYIAARDDTPAVAFPVTIATSFAVFVGWRSLRICFLKHGSATAGTRHVLMVGAGPIARSIANTLRNDALHPVTICGFVDDTAPLSAQVIGRVDDLAWLARAEFVDQVIIALPQQHARTREVVETAYRNHLDICLVPDLPAGPWPNAGGGAIGDIPVITLDQAQMPRARLFLKRLLDVAGAAFALVVAAPVMAIAALLITLDSPGPVMYSAERSGVKGRRFRCYKFRSMVTEAEKLKDTLRDRNQREGPIFKIDDDPRITRIGSFLRRYSLDELPQLWNVLRGDMSLVGPRPHPVDEVNHYELRHFRRLDVKPGLTGLWQVTARSNPSFELNMHLDLTYIENWTLLLDLRILLQTVRVLFAPEGA